MSGAHGSVEDAAHRAEAVRLAAEAKQDWPGKPRISRLVGRRLDELRHEVWALAETMSGDELAGDARHSRRHL